MKIVAADVFVTCPGRNFVTLKITTDEGIVGLGDATLNGRELSVASYLKDHLCPQLIGRDAHRIEDIWQFFYKGAYWRRGPVNPEVATATPLTGWLPLDSNGFTTKSGLTNANVTLTTLEASRERIVLSGTLTANINLIVPAWRKKWTVVNNCTGSFTVTIKTTSGTGVSIPSGMTAYVVGNGTNISQDSNLLGITGRLIGAPLIFTSSSSYTPSAGTTAIIVQVVGGGGGGGGTPATSSTQNSVGGGGGGGAIAVSYIPVSSLTLPVSIAVGTAGSGVVGAAGVKGGDTSFGSYLTAGGGSGGLLGTAATSGSPYVLQCAAGGVATGGNIYNSGGCPGGQATYITISAGISGFGGSSPLGGGGGVGGSTASGGYTNGKGPGGGGAGSAAGSSASAQMGGSGVGGIVMIWELS